jgi:Xaa-Pro aminopeptidase
MMKSDLDRLMEARGLDAFVVTGGEGYSSVRDYLTNGAHISQGYILKKRGEPMLLVVNPMEIEEGRKSGVTTITTIELGYPDLIKEANGDTDKAAVALWGVMLRRIGLDKGKVGIYGRGEINVYLQQVEALRALYPQFQFVGENGTTLFDEAMVTKDAEELARIVSIGQRTGEVLDAAWNYIASHKVSADETVVDAAGKPLTIGAVKRFVIRELMERGLEDTGMIFAQGRDGGFPHSRGENDEALKAGRAIVFDLFPREMGGGYYHDCTRTWCIGYAPPEVQQTYEQVMTAFDMAVEAFGLSKPTQPMQLAVLDYFEQQGHPTARSQPGAMAGYVHSLGHGIGLNIHEEPRITHLRDSDIFQKGNVVTIEPGLYYPDEGYGVRVEDSFIITEQGELISITPFKKDLIIPIQTLA